MTLSFTSQLNIDNVYLHQLTLHPEKFYRKSTRPKMKFGRKQINKDGSDKMRTTYEPCPDLKYKQRLIKQRIEQIKLPQCMFGGISGLNNIIMQNNM